MEQIFNKLVRDNIPDKIINNNETPVTRILDDNEYKEELYKKLLEEADEVINSKTKEELLEELADVYEVLNAISSLNDFDMEIVKENASQKRKKRGGFDKRIFLIKTIDNK